MHCDYGRLSVSSKAVPGISRDEKYLEIHGNPVVCRRSVSGFTLIELLVVIAIISILATMLIPTLTNARELARQSACMSNLKGMGAALGLYSNDFDGFFPTNMAAGHWTGPQLYAYHSGAPKVYNYGLLYGEEYVSSSDAFLCPSAEPNGGTYFNTDDGPAGRRNYFWEDDPTTPETFASYYYWLWEPFVTMGGELYVNKRPVDFQSASTAIMTDVLYFPGMESHKLNDGDYLANVLTVSGSVSSWKDSENNQRYSIKHGGWGISFDEHFRRLWASFSGN